MPALHRIDRRTLLVDLGRGTVAVALFGLVACGDDDGEDTGSGGGTTTTTAPPSGSTSSTTSEPGAEDLRWERADLGFVSAYVLVRGSEAAVVDTGVGGSAPQIEAALGEAGVDWEAVGHVLLTHQHGDHAGSIGEVLAAADGATGYAGAADIPNITSPRALTAVADGEEVFGLQVVATPGHTAGHIAVFDAGTGLLVVGDAATNEGGTLSGSNPQFTADQQQADESVRKLAQLDVETILFGHGEPVEQGGAAALQQLAESL